MKRLQVRYSVLTVLWVSVGVILFAVLWAMLRGKSDATGGVAGVGALMFILSGAMYGSEVHLAIKAVNLRVDDRIRHGTAQDVRLARLERLAGFGSSVVGPDDTPPHGVPVYPSPGEDIR